MMAPPPDFVIVGGQQDGKFFLLASKTLTEAELRVEAERPDYFGCWSHTHPPRSRRFITAEIKDLVVAVGDSYAEAFRTLFEEWSPESRPRPQIDGVRAVTQRARNIAYHELGIDTGDDPLALP